MTEFDYEQAIASYEKEKLQEEFNRNLAAMKHLVLACEAFADYIPQKIARDEQFAAEERYNLENRRQFVKATREKLEKTGHLTKKCKSVYEEEKAAVRETDRRIASDLYFKNHASSLVHGRKIQINPPPGKENAAPSFYEFTEKDKRNLEKAIATIINCKRYASVDKSPNISEQMAAYAEKDEMLYRYDHAKSMDIITSQQNDFVSLDFNIRKHDESDRKNVINAFETISNAGRKLMKARCSLNGIQYEAYLQEQKTKDAELIYDQQEAIDFPTRKEKVVAAFKNASEYMSGQIVAAYEKIKNKVQTASANKKEKDSIPANRVIIASAITAKRKNKEL